MRITPKALFALALALSALAAGCGRPAPVTYANATYGFSATYGPGDFRTATLDAPQVRALNWYAYAKVAAADGGTRNQVQVQVQLSEKVRPPLTDQDRRKLQTLYGAPVRLTKLGGVRALVFVNDNDRFDGARWRFRMYYLEHGRAAFWVIMSCKASLWPAWGPRMMAIVNSFRVTL